MPGGKGSNGMDPGSEASGVREKSLIVRTDVRRNLRADVRIRFWSAGASSSSSGRTVMSTPMFASRVRM
ncbi:MAG: hypothetical protein ACR2QM_12125 [Longimicrobiales bacterium]